MPTLSRVTTTAEEAMSIKYNTMVYDLKRQGKNVLVLSLGEAFFEIPLFSFKDLPFPGIYHYSHSRGIPELRTSLAKYFKESYDFPFDPEQEIIITAGSKAAIHMTFMSILDPGDEVIMQEPLWVSYPEQVKLCYGVPVQVPYNETVYDFEKYITKKTKAIVVNSPHNPTGYVYTKKELNHLLKLARKHDIWLLCDEAYSDFAEAGEFVSLGSIDKKKEHSIIFNSISKNYGISGWRLGYVISNKDVIYNVLKANQHLITCPATILEYYIAAHFLEILKITKPQIKQLLNKRMEISNYMEKIGLQRLPGGATFYFFVSINPSKLTSEEFCTKLLQERYISAVPGLGYGKSCDKFIRVSVGTATFEDNKRGLDNIKELIDITS